MVGFSVGNSAVTLNFREDFLLFVDWTYRDRGRVVIYRFGNKQAKKLDLKKSQGDEVYETG